MIDPCLSILFIIDPDLYGLTRSTVNDFDQYMNYIKIFDDQFWPMMKNFHQIHQTLIDFESKIMYLTDPGQSLTLTGPNSYNFSKKEELIFSYSIIFKSKQNRYTCKYF